MHELRVGEQRRELFRVGRRERHQEPAGPLLGGDVVAHQEGAQHVIVALFFEVVEEAVLARDHLAVPNPEPEPHGVIPVAGVADHIGIAAAGQLHRGRRLDLFQPPQRVAQFGGALVVGPLARLDHQVPDAAPHVDRVPFEEAENLRDHGAILGLALPPDAGAAAAPDVKVETGTVAPFPRDVVGAAPDREDPADDRERAPHRGDVGEGSEVPRPGDVAAPGDQHARKRLLDRDHDAGIALVILEPDVESRLVFLDEGVLEQQRLRFIGDDDGVDVGDELAQRGRS